MPRRLVNREEIGKLIAKTSGAISMIDDSHYNVKSKSSNNTYTVTATQSGWVCSCPDYVRATMPSASMYMQLNIDRGQSATSLVY